jgi:hypothetical protein
MKRPKFIADGLGKFMDFYTMNPDEAPQTAAEMR